MELQQTLSPAQISKLLHDTVAQGTLELPCDHAAGSLILIKEQGRFHLHLQNSSGVAVHMFDAEGNYLCSHHSSQLEQALRHQSESTLDMRAVQFSRRFLAASGFNDTTVVKPYQDRREALAAVKELQNALALRENPPVNSLADLSGPPFGG
jgi:hypothetical protein